MPVAAIAVLVSAGILRAWRRRRAASEPAPPAPTPPAGVLAGDASGAPPGPSPDPPGDPDPPADPDPPGDPDPAGDPDPPPDPEPPADPDPVGDAVRHARERALAAVGDDPYPDPERLEHEPVWEEAVRALSADAVPTHVLVEIAGRGAGALSAAAAAALASRPDVPAGWAARAWRRVARGDELEVHFLLIALRAVPGRMIGPALKVEESIADEPLARFVADRVDGGEPLDDETFEGHLDVRDVARVREFLDRATGIPEAVGEALAAWSRGKVDVRLLETAGRTWARPFDQRGITLAGDRGSIVARIAEALTGSPARSVAVVGERGTGKTALLRRALDALPPETVVFEATAADVNAGASFVGELEGRVRELAEALAGRPVVWVLPGLDEALWAGQHNRNPQGLLDALLPHVAAGRVRIAAEVAPGGWDAVVRHRPKVADAFAVVRVPPLPAHEACAVAEQVAERAGVRPAGAALAEAQELAEHFVPGVAAPGALVSLVEAAAAAVLERGGTTLTAADVLGVLTRSSGLPLALLDPDVPLRLDDVRTFLERRVLGQPEAVETLVERVAMIKAGLTDASRPLGVFLFVGPTGTGKTEIAKALAELLFGSPDRLIRLDMSEYQTPDALERLLSDSATEPRAAPLVAAVRKAPFSVVLLDEFEKAAAPVWDVFLQVFDDGRLTDLRGRTTDLRRCVIILTSNAGSSIAGGAGLGFERRRDAFSPQAVERALAAAFRPEFLNRIDRVVVFRPFERGQMRALLDKELADVVQRRGLRRRPWAIEYDESALTLLIERGFSPELGARPLKRAVERYLLAPLAQAIVEQQAPSGDQFLFVTARRDRIEVRFVDPDAVAGDAPEPPPGDDDARPPLDVRAVALHPTGEPAVSAFLLAETGRIAAAVRGEAIQHRKADALAALGRDGFWEDPGRFEVLARANYLDRLEEALRTAENLSRRLARVGRGNGRGAELAALLALRLHVLDSALAGIDRGIAEEVVIGIRPAAGAAPGAAAELCARLAAMYAAWADRRGMPLERLTAAEPPDGEHLLLAGGLGAAVLLAPEEGLHVEERGRGAETERITALVAIAPRGPDTRDAADVAALARRLLAGRPAAPAIVRRYRERPSPLVRDAVRGFRTGRLERLLAGDLDLAGV